MLYDNFMRAKMKNISHYKTAIGYPCEFESAKEQELIDYRIYGNSGGVGDKTKNLIDIGTQYEGDWDSSYVGMASGFQIEGNVIKFLCRVDGVSHAIRQKDIFVTGSVILNFNSNVENLVGTKNERYIVQCFNENNEVMQTGLTGGTFNTYYNAHVVYGINRAVTIDETVHHVRFGLTVYSSSKDDSGKLVTVSELQVEQGTSATEYEPYGYKIPILNNGNSTNTIYISNPLEINQYAEYKSQSIYRDNNIESASLPILTAAQGNNILTTDTTIEPEKISVKFQK